MLAATNGYDALVTLIIGIPAIIGAFAGVFAWRNSRAAKDASVRTEDEVTSPNGESTATAVYEIRKAVVGLTAGVSELKAGQAAERRVVAEHRALDDVRFGAVFAHLNIEDPAS